jgi:hypothetical protein
MTIFTPKQRANLQKLASYLLALPADYDHFDMSSYLEHNGVQKDPQDYAIICAPCGTVACAVGHGPAAGIEPDPRPAVDDSSWFAYCIEKFGLTPGGIAWSWCFSATWACHDNTPQGAGQRILTMLGTGVPEDFVGGMETWEHNYELFPAKEA